MARDRATSKELIIAGAAVLFARDGYLNTTVDRIAEQVGVTKPTIYAYVSGKPEILESILSKLVAFQVDAIESSQRRLPDDPRGALLSLVGELSYLAIKHRHEFAVYYREVGELRDEAVGRELRQHGRRAVAAMVRAFDAAKRQGLVADDLDHPIMAELLLNTIGTLYTWVPESYDPDGSTSIQDGVQRLAEGLLGSKP